MNPFIGVTWELDHGKENGSRYFIVHGPVPKGINAEYGYPVCDSMNRHHCISPDEDEANGRLIAQAPTLLQVLIEGRDLVLRSVTMVTHGKPTLEEAQAWIEKADAAIQKVLEG